MSNFEDQAYCDMSTPVNAVAGRDVQLCVFDSTGTELLAVAGQQGLTVNRSQESIEVSAKDTSGGWKSFITGMKEWSIETEGLYVISDTTHKTLGAAYESGEPVCVKIINVKNESALFGGVGLVTEYSLEAPFDEAMTYTISLSGIGKLTDLSEIEATA
jgi:TP901-1 family phage major tail protein